ncbi:MAG: BatA domain-containing protein [Flavobacteriaceae bacterium]|nr:BatA domain-containing protein [Flavobacteriaceae bacterium]
MQFKHPEILYFLGFLLIPVLVHLFQLQRFKKTPFTNVALLQKLVLQTRKSSRLKKWIILTSRLLLFAAIIFAFSQPYSSNQKTELAQHNFIYLDNSFSINTDGEKGNLLQNSIKEIIENTSDKEVYSLLTNTNFHENISASELKNILLKTTPKAKNRTLEAVFLKIKNHEKQITNTLGNSILISDFQQDTKNTKTNVTNVTSLISFIKVRTTKKNNLSIDRLSIDNQSNSNFLLNVTIKNQGVAIENISIALYNDSKVFSKQTFSIEENKEKTISFPIQNQKIFKGKISLDYSDAFDFDNHYFFTLNPAKKINIFSIGKNHNFLAKIYTKNEFNFSSSSIKNINYNVLEKQELIILNELNEIPNTLVTFLQKHLNENHSLVIIPSQKININSYNSFLKKLKTGTIQHLKRDSLRITNINFKNPFYKDVFSKEIKNFHFPIVKSYYETIFTQASSLVRFENQKSFISKLYSNHGNVYWSSSSLHKENTNFLSSPLIVPIFYNFGKLSALVPKSSYTINKLNLIDIPIALDRNHVLSINSKTSSFIPLQQAYKSKVSLETSEQPNTNGFYEVTYNNKTIHTLAFNYDNSESSLQFLNIKELIKDQENLVYSESVSAVFQGIKEKNKVTWFWKWFLALAIVSLVFEILILKFFKP